MLLATFVYKHYHSYYTHREITLQYNTKTKVGEKHVHLKIKVGEKILRENLM